MTHYLLHTSLILLGTFLVGATLGAILRVALTKSSPAAEDTTTNGAMSLQEVEEAPLVTATADDGLSTASTIPEEHSDPDGSEQEPSVATNAAIVAAGAAVTATALATNENAAEDAEVHVAEPVHDDADIEDQPNDVSPAATPTPNDLTLIRGIDADIASALQNAGVTGFAHIAAWTKNEVRHVNDAFGARRVQQENWIEQAQILADGGHTHFAEARLAEINGPEPLPEKPASEEQYSTTVQSAEGEQNAGLKAAATAVAAAVAAVNAANSDADEIEQSDLADDDAQAHAARQPDTKGEVTAASELENDLTLIRGVDADVAAALKSAGTINFRQMAGWTASDVARVNDALDAPHRVQRENWIEQAQILANGGHTRFSEAHIRTRDVRREPSESPAVSLAPEPEVAGAVGRAPSDEANERAIAVAAGLAAATAAAAVAVPAAGESEPETATLKPEVEAASADDLTLLRGVDESGVRAMRDLGVNSFEQIARWRLDDVRRANEILGPGRVQRGNWIEQAQILASGNQTLFSRLRLRGAPIATVAAVGTRRAESVKPPRTIHRTHLAGLSATTHARGDGTRPSIVATTEGEAQPAKFASVAGGVAAVAATVLVGSDGEENADVGEPHSNDPGLSIETKQSEDVRTTSVRTPFQSVPGVGAGVGAPAGRAPKSLRSGEAGSSLPGVASGVGTPSAKKGQGRAEPTGVIPGAASGLVTAAAVREVIRDDTAERVQSEIEPKADIDASAATRIDEDESERRRQALVASAAAAVAASYRMLSERRRKKRIEGEKAEQALRERYLQAKSEVTKQPLVADPVPSPQLQTDDASAYARRAASETAQYLTQIDAFSALVGTAAVGTSSPGSGGEAKAGAAHQPRPDYRLSDSMRSAQSAIEAIVRADKEIIPESVSSTNGVAATEEIVSAPAERTAANDAPFAHDTAALDQATLAQPERSPRAEFRSVRSEALLSTSAHQSSSRRSRTGQPDDLKRIRGVGVVVEKKLFQLGVTRYEDIAAWTPDDVQRVSESLDFKGRIERESWIEQAKTLIGGETSPLARRLDGGDEGTA